MNDMLLIGSAVVIVVLAALCILVLKKRAWLVVTLALVAITSLMISGFWFSPGELGVSDWDYYFSYHEVLRRMTLTYHEVPQWNPYICGGTSAIGDPEFPFFTFNFLLELLLGVPTGFRLAIFITTAVGAVGMAWLVRGLRGAPIAGLVAGLIYGFGSVNLLEIVEGHQNIFAAMWIPWVLLAWLGAYRQAVGGVMAGDPSRTKFRGAPAKQGKPELKQGLGWIHHDRTHGFIEVVLSWRTILTGLLLAAMFYAGGVYLLMYMAFAFLFFVAFAKNKSAALVTTIAVGLWALGFAAAKLIPVFLWLKQFQDAVYASSAFTLAHLHEIFLGRHLHGVEDVIPNQGGGWHEYGAYVGPFALALAIFALSQFKRRLIRLLVIAFVIALLVSASGPLLKPLFDQASFLPRSNVSRVVLFAVIPLAILAGFGATRGAQFLVRRVPKLRLIILLGAALTVGALTYDIGTLSTQLSKQAFILDRQTEEPIKVAARPIQYTIGDEKVRYEGIDYTRAYLLIEKGWGTQSYCSVLSPQIAIKTVQHHDENNDFLQISDPNGSVQLASWTPTQIIVLATANVRSEIVVNANFARGWTIDGEPAKEVNNRLAAKVAPGQHVLVFRYTAPGFQLGATITLATILACLLLLWRTIRRLKHSAQQQNKRAKDGGIH